MTSEDNNVEGIHSGMDVVLHPLVVISVSDHFTRTRLTTAAKGNANIVGVLLGLVNKGKLEITNSFDIKAEFDNSTGKLVSVDKEFLVSRTEQFITVLPNTTVVGWYMSGSSIDPENALVISRALSSKAETLFALSFDGMAAYDEKTKDLPIHLYEAELKGSAPAEQTVVFKNVPYHIITIEAERIGVDHIAKTSTTEGSSQLTVHVLGMQGAMKMLYSRIEVIREYLEKVQKGTAPFDHEIMRKIGSLHDLLLAAQSSGFEERFFLEYNDEMLLAYLTSITEGLQVMNSMVDTHVVCGRSKPSVPRGLKPKPY